MTTPSVEASYADGSSNSIRALSRTYPDGRVVSDDYGTAGDIDDHASRIAALVDDDLVLRDRAPSGSSSSSSSSSGGPLGERLYASQDGNWNVTAVVDAAGSVQERYEYDPYGNLSVLDSSFGARAASSFDWETAYAGYRFDAVPGLYVVRFRMMMPLLGWVQRDPLEYVSSATLVEYVTSQPLIYVDPLGECLIELRFGLLGYMPGTSAIPDVRGGEAYHHSYIVVTDIDGTQREYRAGPSRDPAAGALLGATGGAATQGAQSPASANQTSPGAGIAGDGNSSGPWGALDATWGPHGPGSDEYIAFESGGRLPPSQTLLFDNRPCDNVHQQLLAFINRVNSAHIPYNPFSQNSNTFAFQAIRYLGFPKPQSKGLNIPGSKNQLPFNPPPSIPPRSILRAKQPFTSPDCDRHFGQPVFR